MSVIENKKQVNRLIFLFMMTYLASYLTRINFGAIVSEIEASTGILKSLLSLSLTGSFITYGLGQIVSGVLGDYISPKKLITLGFVLTIFMNLCVTLFYNPYIMAIIWCINGFAQSFMWPPLVKLMLGLLSEEDYKKATVRVSWGSSIGSILIYLISPVLIKIAGWKSVFIFSAVSASFMLFLFTKYCVDIKAEKRIKKEKSTHRFNIFHPVLIAIMIAIVLQGMLRDGVTTWMPSLISETYSLGSSISILSSVVLPVFSILSFSLTSKIYATCIKNPMMLSCVLFLLGGLSSFGLIFFNGFNPLVSVGLGALLTGCMHGVNLILICMLPAYFKTTGSVGTISGVFNSCTYVGSAISTYGVAYLVETFSWSLALQIWMIVALAGGFICLLCMPMWNKYKTYLTNYREEV